MTGQSPGATPGTDDPRRARQHRGLALTITLTWVVVLAGVQLLLDGRLVVVPWLALGPLAASLALDWRRTAVVAATSVLAVALISAGVGDLLTPLGAVRVLGSSALAGFAVLSASVRVGREQRIRAVTEIATVAQTAILHPVPARVAGVALASRYVSASADALVGGDLYDVVATERGVRLVVGDVRGKGLAAVHTAAAVLSAFRHNAPLASTDLDAVARAVEEAVLPRLGPEDFVTAVLCEVRPDGGLDVVLCGHPAPLRLCADGTVSLVGEHRSPPIGLGLDVRVETSTLREGERLLLFTDGLVEARDRAGDFFDLPAHAKLVAPSGAAAVHTLDADLDRLLTVVQDHLDGGSADDLALLLVQPLPAPAERRRV